MYQALYRKWRPKTFDEVVGQEHITEILKRQVRESHLSHAYLFLGTRGTGKTTCAKILAKAVNCEHPINGNPCCTCKDCKSIEAGTEMDVVELDAASNNGVDDVRALRDEAVFSPAALQKRVYIIDEVHMLSNSAFNALLKILEEPPEHLIFILATTELKNIPNTILSRCQRHNFRRIPIAKIEEQLTLVSKKEEIAISPDALHLVAQLADGGMRDALSILDQCASYGNVTVDSIYSTLGMLGGVASQDLLSKIFSRNVSEALLCFQQYWINGKSPTLVLEELENLLRDLLIFQVTPNSYESLLSGIYDKNSLEILSKGITSNEIIRDIEIIQMSQSDLKAAYNDKTVAELCIMNLCRPDLFYPYRASSLQYNNPMSAAEPLQKHNHNFHSVESPSADVKMDVEEKESHKKSESDSRKISEVQFDAITGADNSADLLQEKSISVSTVSSENANSAASEITEESAWNQIVESLQNRKDFPPGLLPILRNKNEMAGHLEGRTLTIKFFSELSYNQYLDKGNKEKLIEACHSVLNKNINVVFIKDLDSSQRKIHDVRELGKFKEVHFIGGNK